MRDTGWDTLRGSWERVRWARLRADFPTGAAAAASLGMKENTYTAYERVPTSSKSTALNDQRAGEFGRKFRVNWVWLLTGDGTPFDPPLTSHQHRVVMVMRDKSEDEQARIANAVELLTGTGS